MRPVIHGGDIYQNEIELDFSVNINPFGIPEKSEGGNAGIFGTL